MSDLVCMYIKEYSGKLSAFCGCAIAAGTGMACGLYEGLSPLPKDPVPGMAYVPYQQWDAQLHSIDRALDAGTLFPVLDKPFTGRRGEPR